MWKHFQKLYGPRADAELHKFILATVNNVSNVNLTHYAHFHFLENSLLQGRCLGSGQGEGHPTIPGF